MSEMLFAFVLMPFDSEFDDVYRIGIKEIARELDVVAERVDEQTYSETILERIYRQIEASDFVIADMTGKNPNVFYEVGYAHAKKKICILITKNADDIPFDLKHHRHLIYGDRLLDLRTRLQQEIRWAKSEVVRLKATPLTISRGKLYGHLTKNSWSATAEIDLKIDIHNHTDKRSPDLEAIYLHTGGGWTFRQGTHDCPSTASEVGDYKLRHFISPSVPRLSPGAWSQIKLTGRKLVWMKTKGDEPAASYKLSGIALLDIVTSEGNYTKELDLDVEASEFPF